MNFDELHDMATNMANCVFGDIKMKEECRENILMLVALSCAAYGKNKSFKQDVDNYLDYQKFKKHFR